MQIGPSVRFALENQEPQYFYNIPMIKPVRLGFGIIDSYLARRLPHGLSNLHLLPPVTVNGIETIVLECAFSFRIKGIPRDLQSLFELSSYNLAKLYIDPATCTPVQEEWTFGSFDSVISGKLPVIIEYPDGFYHTPMGYAPKRTLEKNNKYASAPWKISEYTLVENRVWMLEHTIINHSSRHNGADIYIKNVSLDPVDPSLFQMNPSDFEIHSATEGTRTITGQVVHTGAHVPVSGAKVVLQLEKLKSQKELKQECLTGADGAFRFERLPEGKYLLYAEKSGMAASQSRYQDREFWGNSFATDQMEDKTYAIVDLEKEDQNIDLPLGEDQTLQGKVIKDENEEPVANATIYVIYQPKTFKKIQTGADGKFQIEKVPPKPVMIAAEAEGYARSSGASLCKHYSLSEITREFFLQQYMMDIGISNSKYKDIQVVSLDTKPAPGEIVLRLEPEYKISGKVTDYHGNPVKEAYVYCYPFMDRMDKTDAEGRFAFTEFSHAKEEIYLSVAAEGYVQSLSGPLTFSQPELKQDILLGKGGILKGTIVDEEQNPLPGIALSLNLQHVESASPSAIFANTASSNLPEIGNPGQNDPPVSLEDGTIHSKALVPGKYFIKAVTDGYQPFQKQDVVIENEKETVIEILMKRSAKISGKVLSPTGEPVSNITVTLNRNMTEKEKSQNAGMYGMMGMGIGMDIPPADPDAKPIPQGIQVQHVSSDKEGKFSFDKILPDTYFLQAERHAKDMLPQGEFLEDIHPGEENAVIQFKEPFKKLPIIRGTVVDRSTGDKIPVFKAEMDGDLGMGMMMPFKSNLYGTNPGYSFVSGVINNPSNGLFTSLPLSFRSCRILVTAPGYAYTMQGSWAVKPEEIVETFFPLRKEGIIKGRLLNRKTGDKNQPELTLHWITNPADNFIYTEDVRSLLKTAFSADGFFQINNVPAGHYRILQSPSAEWQSFAVKEENTADIGTVVLPDWDYREMFKLKIESASLSFNQGSEFSLPPIWGSQFQDQMAVIPAWIHSVTREIPLKLDAGKNGMIVNVNPSSLIQSASFEIPSGTAKLTGTAGDGSDKKTNWSIKLISDLSKSPVYFYKTECGKDINRFSFTNLPEGKYLAICRESQSFIKPVVKKTFRCQEISVWNGKDNFVALRFGNGKSVEGVVVNENNEPVADANVQLRLDYPISGSSRFADDLCLDTPLKTDSNGHFAISDIQPGTYKIWAWYYTAGTGSTQTIEIDKNDIKGMKFVLKPQ